MKFGIKKRSIIIGGRATSVSLEDDFWSALKEIARRHGVTASEVVTAIDAGRSDPNLSSAVRIFVLGFYRDMVLNLEDGDLSSRTLADLENDKIRLGR